MSGVPVGRLFGIPLLLHPSWLLIFTLLVWSLAVGFLPQTLPGRSGGTYLALGVVTAALFFLSIVAHELGHALTARRLGVGTRRITLFFFGGVAELEGNLRQGRHEAIVAIAGPIVSLVIAALTWLAASVAGEFGTVALWLARINLTLALFNLLPLFPLDGGRVLRGLVWARTSLDRATLVAVNVGRVMSFGLIALGVFLVLRGNVIGGVWLAVLAFFLQGAAAAEASATVAQGALGRLPPARTLAQEDWPTVTVDTPLQQIADLVLETGRRAYPVTDALGRFVGLVTLDGLRGVERERWPWLPAGRVMLREVHHLPPEASALDTLRVFGERGVHQMPVLDGERYVGMISRAQLMALLQLYGGGGAARSPES